MPPYSSGSTGHACQSGSGTVVSPTVSVWTTTSIRQSRTSAPGVSRPLTEVPRSSVTHADCRLMCAQRIGPIGRAWRRRCEGHPATVHALPRGPLARSCWNMAGWHADDPGAACFNTGVWVDARCRHFAEPWVRRAHGPSGQTQHQFQPRIWWPCIVRHWQNYASIAFRRVFHESCCYDHHKFSA